MDSKRWYVVQTKPHKEAVVCGQLSRIEREIDLFFPKIKNHMGVRPLFPSYVFVRFITENLGFIRLVKYTRGVLRLISTQEGQPLSVEDAVIATIQSRMGADGLVDQRQVFQMGQSVRVQRGPLKDLIGILEKSVSDRQRVQVLFKMLRYPIRAVMQYTDLVQVGF